MIERPVGEIRETFAALRIVCPKADAAVERSLRLYGQMSPVVCATTEAGIELLDGFKRLRASRRLERPRINTVLLDTTERACKASMIQLNRVASTISDLEEALILQSLHRVDGLSQVEIATMLGRDKSWVSRRIMLSERMSDEVRQHVELGLIPISVARELARLPRAGRPRATRPKYSKPSSSVGWANGTWNGWRVACCHSRAISGRSFSITSMRRWSRSPNQRSVSRGNSWL